MQFFVCDFQVNADILHLKFERERGYPLRASECERPQGL